MDKQPVGQLPDLTQSNNDDEIMVITNDEYNQLKKEKISDFITDLTSTDENNAIVKGTDGKLFTKDFGNASNITEGTLPVSVLPDIPKDKLPEIETDDLPDSGITAGTYTYPTDIVVNSKGQVTSITEGQAGANNANQDLSNLGPLGLDKINQSKALETGAVSSDADVYADIQKYAHSTFDRSKFEVVGSPVITDDGIASGFSHSDYINLSVSLNNTQKITNYIKGTFINTSNPQILWSYYTTRLEMTSTTITFKWLGTNLLIADFKTPLQNNDIFEIFLILNDNGQNKLVARVNGEASVNITNNTALSEGSILNIRIGDYYQSDNYSFVGTIELKSVATWADNIPVFSGNKTGLDVIKPDNYEVIGTPTITEDGIASGFDTNSYIISAENFNLSAKKFKIKYHCKIGQPEGSIGVVSLYNNQGLPVFNTVYNHYTVGVILRENFSGAGDISSYTSNYTGLSYTANFEIENNTVTINVLYDDGTTRTANVDFSALDVSSWDKLQLRVGRGIWIGRNIEYLDLNSVELENNCNLVYQPCLKIPYTLSKTGSKIVDAAYRDRVQDVYEQYGTAMYYTLDEENQNFTLPMGEIYGMIEKKNEKLNNPFSLFDSKYSETLLYNASWLLSNGTYYAKSVYVTAYEALVVENNSEIEAGTSVTLPSGGNYVKRGLSVKLSTAEDITDFDFVINTTDETFRLPLLNGSERNIDYSQGETITSGYTAPCNGVVSGSNTALTSATATLMINDILVAYANGGDTIQDGTNFYIKVSKGDKITFTNFNTSQSSSTRMLPTFFPAVGNGSLYYYVGETVQNANLIDAGRFAEQLANKANIDLSNITEAAETNIKNLIYPDFNNVVDLPTTLNLVQQADEDCYLIVRGDGGDLGIVICDADGVVLFTIADADTTTNVATVVSTPLLPKGTYFKAGRSTGTVSLKKVYTIAGGSNV